MGNLDTSEGRHNWVLDALAEKKNALEAAADNAEKAYSPGSYMFEPCMVLVVAYRKAAAQLQGAMKDLPPDPHR